MTKVQAAQRQDICLFCAFRNAFPAPVLRRRFLQQSRTYQDSKSRRFPPAAQAVAREDEDEPPPEPTPQPKLTGGGWGSLAGAAAPTPAPRQQREAQIQIDKTTPLRSQYPPENTFSSESPQRISPLKLSFGRIEPGPRYDSARTPQRSWREHEGELPEARGSPGRGSFDSRDSTNPYRARSRFEFRERSHAGYEQNKPKGIYERSRQGSSPGQRDQDVSLNIRRVERSREPRLVPSTTPPKGAIVGGIDELLAANVPNQSSRSLKNTNGGSKADGSFAQPPRNKAWGSLGRAERSLNRSEAVSRGNLEAGRWGQAVSFETQNRSNGEQEVVAESIIQSPLLTAEQEEERRRSRIKLGSRSDRLQIEDEEAETTPTYQNNKTRNRRRRDATPAQNYYQLQDDPEDLLEGRSKKKKARAKQESHRADAKSRIHLPEFISVENLAKQLGIRFNDFVAQLREMGFEDPRNDHILDMETSALIAVEYNFEPVFTDQQSESRDLVARPATEDMSDLPRRPPIVTIMGHVDHGKTTILDYLRKTSVAASEHGGITQHIGAFSVKLPNTSNEIEKITFLDTPGHAAFLEMRRRGANVTDIVILVVAADDSVKPQTIEAIKHAMDAKVDIIVAINKVDREDANIERVKQDLSRHDLSVEDYGGNYQAIPVSGKTGQGMRELEEATVLLASVNDYRAETTGMAEGWIIESKVTLAGRVATVLVRRGTMRPGDYIVAGTTWARIRTLRDDTGALVEEAPPGTPVQIDGWRGDDPNAGLEVLQADSEEHAKAVIEYRQEQAETARLTSDTVAINEARASEAGARQKVLDWEAEQEWAKKSRFRRPKDNEGWVEGAESADGPKQIHFVIKADVAGSVEAVHHAVAAVGNNEITANVVRSGVGHVNESDIQLLSTTGDVGYIVSFNQPVEGQIQRSAEVAGLKILDHNIIYKVTDDVRERLGDHLLPLVKQRVVGEAEVGKIFEISTKKGTIKIAGCKISNGSIARSKKIRVQRKGKVVYDGKLTDPPQMFFENVLTNLIGMLDSLKNVKKDVTEMRKGTECGMGFQDWEDFQEGDQIQSYEEKSEKRTLY